MLTAGGIASLDREAVMIRVGSEISESPVKADLQDLHTKCAFLFHWNLFPPCTWRKKELIIQGNIKNCCLIS